MLLRSRSKRLLGLTTSLLVLAAISPLPRAIAASVGSFSYTAYYGGVAAVEIDTRIDLSEARYEIVSSAKSIGVLDYLFPFTSTATGRGGIDDPAMPGQRFMLRSRYRGRDRLIELAGRPGAAPRLSIAPPIPLEDRDPVPSTLRVGTLDPIAALVAGAMRTAGKQACSGGFPVFNGKTRADIQLRHIGAENLAPSRYSAFSGQAEKCEATYQVLAGGYKKSWFASDQPPPAIQLWIARIAEADFWTPVRAQANAGFAEIMVHMTAAEVGPGYRIGLR